MDGWLRQAHWLGTPVLTWLVAGAAVLGGYLLAHLAAGAIAAHLRKLGARTRRPGFTIAARVAEATRGWLLLLIAVSVALDALYPPGASDLGRVSTSWTLPTWLHLATYALVGIQCAFWLNALLVAWLRRSASGDGAHAGNPVMLGVLTWMAQSVVWVTLLLALLAEGGVNITAFVASLGIGGVAVALALQNVLGDLFASISIGLDKPFEVGEFIAFGSDLGTVTRVGIKSTRIASLSGEELSISNSVLLKNLIHNYSRMQERRVVFNFRMPFDTPHAQVSQAVARVRSIIEAEHPTRFDRGHLTGFGEYGLDFEFVYYVLDPSYNTYAAIQERIGLGMLKAWDELGVKFAVPERKVQAGAASAAPAVQPIVPAQ